MKSMKKAGWLVLVAAMIAVPFTNAWAADAKPTTPKPAAVATAKVEKPKYVASKEGGKYHVPTCANAARIKPENKITFKTKAEAEKAGYKPCEICKP